MLKQDIKNIFIGIAIVLAGILMCVYSTYNHFSLSNSENFHKVKASLVSVDSDYYYEDGDRKMKYYAEWECEIEGTIYTFSTLEYDIRPVGAKTFYLYENENGEMEISKTGSIWSLLKWNVLGILGALGGFVYIFQAVKSIKLQKKSKQR